MESKILPLTHQLQLLEGISIILNDLTIKGGSANQVCALQNHVRTLHTSVVAQMEYGKKLQEEQQAKMQVSRDFRIEELTVSEFSNGEVNDFPD